MGFKFLLLLVNVAVFCHGLDGNATEILKATTLEPAVANQTKTLSGSPNDILLAIRSSKNDVDIHYNYMKNKDCEGKVIREHKSLESAQISCMQNVECDMITDFSCNSDKWTTCKGSVNPGRGSCSWIKVRTEIDAGTQWDHFKDGVYCAPSSEGQKVLSKCVASGSKCMSLGDVESKSYVSFMMKSNNQNENDCKYCYGFDSCREQVKHTNYKTYVTRRATEEYVLTTTNQICDDIGKELVKTSSHCITAATSFGFKFMGIGHYSAPRGCFADTSNNAWWNARKKGSRSTSLRALCLKDDASITLTDKNRLCHDDGLQYVNDYDDCNNTVSKLQNQYPGIKFYGFNSGKFPLGCYLLYNYIYFNQKVEFSRHKQSQHICWKGRTIEPTIASTTTTTKFSTTTITAINDVSTKTTTKTTKNYHQQTNVTLIGVIVGGIVGAIFIMSGAVTVYAIYKRQRSIHFSKDPEEPEPKVEISTSSKRIPIRKIMAGDVDMPTKGEFEKLFRFKDDVTSRLTQYQGKRNDGKHGRNVNSRALPFDYNRVKLKNANDGNDYFNGTWIVSNTEESTYDEIVYSDYIPYAKIDFIVGQKPMPNTLLHHYQVLHENKVDIEIYIHFGRNTKSLVPGKVYHTGNLSRRVFTSNQIGKHLIMTEMEFFDTTSSKTQFKHPMTLFEITGFPKQEMDDVSEVNDILESICLIRKHIKGDSKNMTIMVHDPDGGISGAACVVALYNLLQSIDECVNEKNEIKKSAFDVEVYREINKLRHVRANMVDDFGTYKMIHQCLWYYGQNKAHFDRIKPKSQGACLGNGRGSAVGNTSPVTEPIVNDLARDDFPGDIYFTERFTDQLMPEHQTASQQKSNNDVIINTTPVMNTIVNNSRRDNFEDDVYLTGHTYVN